jgi:PAS domain S-box-containing protein
MRDFVHSERPQWLQQMEPILETLNDGVVIGNDSGQILFVNTVFEEMTGFLRAEIIGRDAVQLLFGAEDHGRVEAFREKTREKGRGREELFLATKDGGRLPAVISLRAIYGPEGGRFVIASWQSVHFPYKTAGEIGLPEEGQVSPTMPYVMASGTFWSHVMIEHENALAQK